MWTATMKSRVFQEVVLLSYTQTYPYFLKISTGDELVPSLATASPLCSSNGHIPMYVKSGKSSGKLYISGISHPYYKQKVNVRVETQRALALDEALINHLLPKELLLRIFSYLDVVALCRCAQVSKYWNLLALDGSNWMHVDLFEFQRDIECDVVRNLAKRCGGFLKTLSLHGCQSVDDGAMITFAQQCNNIEELNIINCKQITNRTCENLGTHCCKLRVLKMDSCVQINDISLQALSQGCPYLEHINISWTSISDTGLEVLCRGCPKLKALILKGCHSISDMGLQSVGYYGHDLRHLNLKNCFKPSLSTRFGDRGIRYIAEGCPKLEFMCISGCFNLSDLSLISISQGCPKLKTLEVAGCSQFSDMGFQALAKNCHELRLMDLEECTLITDTALLHLAAGCPKLERLGFSHCELITDEGIGYLAQGDCGADHLFVLELDGCPLISDSALDKLHRCKMLQRVELYDSQMVTKNGISRLKVHLPNLKVHAYFAPTTPTSPTAHATPRRYNLCCCIM